MKGFDYIICGSGVAGTFLAYSLLTTQLKQFPKILLLDTRSKAEIQSSTKNISYWSRDQYPFGHDVEKVWNKIAIYNKKGGLTLTLDDYRYYSLTEGVLQKKMWEVLDEKSQITFKQEHIMKIDEECEMGRVTTDKDLYYGKYIFDSISIPSFREANTVVRGKSWRVRFDMPVFDESTVTFMDFRTLDTKKLMFFYILPLSTTHAIIELAQFSRPQDTSGNYQEMLHRYLSRVFPSKKYFLSENKYSKNNYCIFMPEKRKSGVIVRLGHAAGLVKPTTGFGLTKIIQDTKRVVHAIQNDLPIPGAYTEIPYWLSDLCMLHMASHYSVDSSFFIDLFKRHSADTVLSFLNEEASLKDLFQLMKEPVSLLLHSKKIS